MTLDQLRYFMETARHEHIGKAARALRLTPSTVSHAISSLEDSLNTRLFQKVGKNISLTEAGKSLVKRAEPLLDQARSIHYDFQENAYTLTGHFRFGATHVLSDKFFAPAWMATWNKFQNTTAEIVSLRSAQVVAEVMGGELDAGLCFSPQDNSEIIAETVFEGKLLPTVRKGHPLFDEKGSSDLTRLNDYPHIAPKAFQGIEVCVRHAELAKQKVNQEPHCLFDSYEVARAMLLASDSWALLADIIVDAKQSRLSAVPTPKGYDAPYSIKFIYHRKNKGNPIFDELKSTVQKNFSHL